jgi:uncharacterized protein YjbJ (UPF0337 family)
VNPEGTQAAAMILDAISLRRDIRRMVIPLTRCAVFRPGTLSMHHQNAVIQLQETKMNWDQIQGKWKQSAGKVKEKWGKLTDDDLTTINGKREQLVGRIQERYGIAKDAAEKQVDEFTSSFRLDDAAKSAKSS